LKNYKKATIPTTGSQKENAQEWVWLLEDHFDLLETDQTKLADNKKIGLAVGYLGKMHYTRIIEQKKRYARINGLGTILRRL
jgi:hypothetical protein